MSLTTDNGMTPADIAAVTNGGGNGGFGWGSDGAFWIIVLFLFAAMGGWGNGFGGNGGGSAPFMMSNDVQRGFDQSAVMSGLNGISTALSTGFSSAEVSRCNAQANILQTINANNNAVTQGLNDVRYTVATEACADRSAISDALKDVIASNTANTQAILDKMCQQELDALKAQNAELQTQLNMAALAASQNAQTSQILADNAAQTRILNPTPVPAYVVANPSCCNQAFNGCGCAVA